MHVDAVDDMLFQYCARSASSILGSGFSVAQSRLKIYELATDGNKQELSWWRSD